VRDANRLAQPMFIEHARGVEATTEVRATGDVEVRRV